MRTSPLTLAAPAKLNLGLRVLGRRTDGYHLLESLFVPIDLADEVTVSLLSPGDRVDLGASGVIFELEGVDGSSPMPRDGANLAAEAARRFLADRAPGWGARVRLRKRIPVSAGMGGGSSDAGAVLRALAAACQIPVGSLARLALGLGADVPYFLDPQPAIVGGIGERIEPVEALPGLSLLLVNPGISLATADVFRAFDRASASLTLARPGSTMPALSRLRDDLRALSGACEELFVNDLESAAVQLCPQIGELRQRLRAVGARATGMSGSGATVFGLFPNTVAAREALEKAAFGPPIWTRVAEFVGTECAGTE